MMTSPRRSRAHQLASVRMTPFATYFLSDRSRLLSAACAAWFTSATTTERPRARARETTSLRHVRASREHVQSRAEHGAGRTISRPVRKDREERREPRRRKPGSHHRAFIVQDGATVSARVDRSPVRSDNDAKCDADPARWPPSLPPLAASAFRRYTPRRRVDPCRVKKQLERTRYPSSKPSHEPDAEIAHGSRAR